MSNINPSEIDQSKQELIQEVHELELEITRLEETALDNKFKVKAAFLAGYAYSRGESPLRAWITYAALNLKGDERV